jgi:CIC family chloride channel protein
MELIHDDTSLPEILRRAEESSYPFFVVLDEKCKLSGVLTLWDLRPILAHQGETASTLKARDLKTSEVVTVHPEDDFETAFHLLEKKGFSSLPVVLPPRDEVVVGILKIEDALTAYNQMLLKEQTLRYPVPGAAKPE